MFLQEKQQNSVCSHTAADIACEEQYRYRHGTNVPANLETEADPKQP